ncbi:hypothetical protein SUGI_0467480 [Cryptomeria japonica]|nr:hypothetical protein SUGI_0467480 [Cryptomeria japonica]
MFTSLSLLYSAFFSVNLLLFVHGCPLNEARALLSLKAAFNNDYGMLKSWKGDDCCVWRGVHCDEIELGGHVTELDISNFYLTVWELDADIDSAFLQLKHLRYLDLSGNYFLGTSFPPGLALLKNLSYLNVAYAYFEGNIAPQLGNLSSLRFLDLSDNVLLNLNSLEWLPSLSMLKYLSLKGINIGYFEPTWESIIGSLFHLTHLDLSDCFYDSTLPVSLLNISSLAVLKFRGNGMSGSMPSWMGNMSKLTSLDLSENCLNGSIPRSLSKPHFLEYLDLSQNDIIGIIPEAIANLTSLRYLNLSINNLTGRIPSNLGYVDANVGSLSYLDLHQNQLEGRIPSGLGLLTNLTYIDLSGNRISGPIPPSLGNLPSLIVLDLHDNQLEGSIPVSLGKISTLRNLSLSDNKMSGDLPLSFAQLSSLIGLDLRNNQLNGNMSVLGADRRPVSGGSDPLPEPSPDSGYDPRPDGGGEGLLKRASGSGVKDIVVCFQYKKDLCLDILTSLLDRILNTYFAFTVIHISMLRHLCKVSRTLFSLYVRNIVRIPLHSQFTLLIHQHMSQILAHPNQHCVLWQQERQSKHHL